AHPLAGAVLAAQGLLVVGHFLVLLRLKAGGGDKYLAALVQGHNFHVVLVGELLDIVPHHGGKARGGAGQGGAGGEPVEQLVRAAGQGQLDAVVGGALHHHGDGGDGDDQNQNHHAD